MVVGWIAVPIPKYGQYLVCPKCRSQVSADSKYCNYCGEMLRPQLILKICSRCQNRIISAAHYCPECGQKQ